MSKMYLNGLILGGGDSSVSIPIGTITAWSTNTAPKGWLICDGGAISRTTYINLFNVIGTTFGIGDGNSTFDLPQNYSKNVMGVPDWYITATNYDKGKVNEIQDNGYLILKGGALNNNQFDYKILIFNYKIATYRLRAYNIRRTVY